MKIKHKKGTLLHSIEESVIFKCFQANIHQRATIKIELYKGDEIMKKAGVVGDWQQVKRLIGDYIINTLQDIIKQYKSIFVNDWTCIAFEGCGQSKLMDYIIEYLEEKEIFIKDNLLIDNILAYTPNLNYDKSFDKLYAKLMYDESITYI
jgi:hypothetical protein